MGIVFSNVTVSAFDDETSFFVKGTPKDVSDLEGWTAFQRFGQEIDRDLDVQVRVQSFMYGAGEPEEATVAEVAYMYKRMKADPSFLERRCILMGENSFSFDWCPEELFGHNFNAIALG